MRRIQSLVAKTFTATAMAALATLPFGAHAASAFFEGNFGLDNDLAIFAFDLSTPGDIVATTFSHSGGLNSVGQAVPEGGFAPVLTLFDASGFAVYGNVGSSNACAGAGNFCWDATFTLQGAPAGGYLLVLSQDDNNAISGPVTVAQMASFYSRAAEPHYTAAFLGLPADGSVNFVRIDGDQRNGHWALDISVNAVVTQVPEPASALLWAVGLAGFALARLRRS